MSRTGLEARYPTFLRSVLLTTHGHRRNGREWDEIETDAEAFTGRHHDALLRRRRTVLRASPRAVPPVTRSLPELKLTAGTPTLAKEK